MTKKDAIIAANAAFYAAFAAGDIEGPRPALGGRRRDLLCPSGLAARQSGMQP